MSETEKILEKVKKVLALSNNNSSQAESETALLLAQEILAKNGLSMDDVNFLNAETKEIVESECISKGRLCWWYGILASIIADNFRCKVWSLRRKHTSTKMMFLGVKSDVELAKTVFAHAVDMVQYHSNSYIKELKLINENLFEEYPKGILNSAFLKYKNTYINGFLSGLRDKFKEQVKRNDWGLVLVVDPEVTKKFEDKKLKQASATSASFTDSEKAHAAGYYQGKKYNPIYGHLAASK